MIRVKRSHFDAFENNDPIGMRCSPHSPKNIEENEKFVNIALPFKKFKMDSDDKFQITRKTKKTVKKNRSDKNNELETWFSYLPKSRKNHHQLIGSLYSSSYGDSIFSLEDVKNIVCGALKEKEEQIRKEYENILLERLSEQWSTFARYNEDFVYKPKDTTLSYMS